MKVYIVTSGEYSDYRIIGVFSTEAKAKESLDVGVGEEIEPFEVDEQSARVDRKHKYRESLKKRGLQWYGVEMCRDGTVKTIGVEHDQTRDYKRQPQLFKYQNIKSKFGTPVFMEAPKEKWFFATYVLAKSEEHAIKVANERRVQLIAANFFDQ